MLGDADTPRWRLFALTDASPESVYERLPSADSTPRPVSETTTIINHAIPPRPTTDTAGTAVATVPEVTVGDVNLEGFETELCEAVAEFGARSNGPAQVRVAVDSVAPLLDHYDFEVVRRRLRTVGRRVRDHDAMPTTSCPRRTTATGADASPTSSTPWSNSGPPQKTPTTPPRSAGICPRRTRRCCGFRSNGAESGLARRRCFVLRLPRYDNGRT